MPSQGTVSTTPEYALGDTAPDLPVTLSDGAGVPIDLTGATVAINIAHASYDYYYAPMARIVDGGACVVDPDQVTNTGFVTWTPQASDLSVAGTFRYNFTVTYPSGKVQTIAPSGNNVLVVRAPLGGNQYA